MSDRYDHVVTLARQQDDMITRSQASQLGMSDGAMAIRRRDHGWRAPIRGALVVPPVRDAVRSHARAALAMAGGTVCLLTAARLHGVPGLPPWNPAEPVDVAYPDGRAFRHRRGCRRHSMELVASQRTDLGGITATTAHRTLQDIVLRLPPELSVPLLDAVRRFSWLEGHHEPDRAGGGHTLGFADLKEAVLRRSDGGEGPGGSPEFWRLVDGRSGSPLESRVRLALVQAGLVPEEVRWALPGPGAQELDLIHLAWPSKRLAVQTYESDLRPDIEGAARGRECSLRDRLTELGWVVLWFTWRDLQEQAGGVVATVRDHLARRGCGAGRQEPRASRC